MLQGYVMTQDTNLVWIDLEMTGLDPNQDVILEIATIITDSQLNIIAHGPSLVINQSKNILEHMNEWSQQQHKKTGLTDLVCNSTTTIQQAERQTVEFIRKYCEPQTALLCGNSIWKDYTFLQVYMPSIIDFLHYRQLDVSTVKELVLRWYPESPYAEYKKKETHRALEDILESIAELCYYRQYFFI